MIIYTMKKAHLLQQAKQMEDDANQSLPSWIILKQSTRYGETMALVRGLRSAAAEPSLYVRREILRNLGFQVLTPKQAGRSAT